MKIFIQIRYSFKNRKSSVACLNYFNFQCSVILTVNIWIHFQNPLVTSSQVKSIPKGHGLVESQIVFSRAIYVGASEVGSEQHVRWD
jgi:hypothetical protein